jgi:hypothetical protein
MTRCHASVALAGVLVILTAAPALAFHCPALVKECRSTADIVAKRDGTDKATVEAARKGCDEALKLHEQGKHKESMIKVGEAIAEVSRALK